MVAIKAVELMNPNGYNEHYNGHGTNWEQVW